MAHVLDSPEDARAAADRHAWHDAYAAYSSSSLENVSPEDLERFAEAAWWTGRLDEAITLRERSYAGYSAAGSKADASRLALTLSWDQVGRGAFAVARGWFANAERLLEGEPDSTEHARLALTRGVTTLMAEGDVARAIGDFDRAYELASRFGDRDTQILALSGKGRALVQSGSVEEGLALLDEATAAAVCGELRPFSTGLVYCITISSCQDLGD